MASPPAKQLNVEWTAEYASFARVAVPSACCMLSLKSPDVSEQARAPVSVSLVLDKSGSMAGQKLELVKHTTNFLVKQLGIRDYVSIITYDSQVISTYPLSQATGPSKDAARAAVARVVAGSCTNLSGGLFQGLQEQLAAAPVAIASSPVMAESSLAAPPPNEGWTDLGAPEATSGPPRKPVKSVFLFTDGLANVGVTDTKAIVATMNGLLTEGTSGKERVKVAAFGFGEDHDPEMLTSIASAGNGTYYYVSGPDAIPPAFADALGGLLSVFAQNVEIRIVATGGARLARVRTGFSQRREGDAIIVVVPDMYAEETKDFLVEFDLPAATGEVASGGQDSESIAVGTVTVSYINTVAGGFATVEAPLSVLRSTVVTGAPDERVSVQKARLDTAEGIQAAVKLADSGQRAEAAKTLSARRDALCAMKPAAPAVAQQLAALTRDVELCGLGFETDVAYGAFGKAVACAGAASHGQQRSNAPMCAPPAAAPRMQIPQQAKVATAGGGGVFNRMMRRRSGSSRKMTRGGADDGGTVYEGAAPMPPPHGYGMGGVATAAYSAQPAELWYSHDMDDTRSVPAVCSVDLVVDDDDTPAPTAAAPSVYSNARQRALIMESVSGV